MLIWIVVGWRLLKHKKNGKVEGRRGSNSLMVLSVCPWFPLVSVNIRLSCLYQRFLVVSVFLLCCFLCKPDCYIYPIFVSLSGIVCTKYINSSNTGYSTNIFFQWCSMGATVWDHNFDFFFLFAIRATIRIPSLYPS